MFDSNDCIESILAIMLDHADNGFQFLSDGTRIVNVERLPRDRVDFTMSDGKTVRLHMKWDEVVTQG